MRESNSPMFLQDYEIELYALTHNAVARPLFQIKGKTPHECTFGTQNDMSSIYSFGQYEWVYYLDHSSLPENKQKLGRILGPHNNKVKEISL